VVLEVVAEVVHHQVVATLHLVEEILLLEVVHNQVAATLHQEAVQVITVVQVTIVITIQAQFLVHLQMMTQSEME
jgi:hypothetical protein